MKIRKLDWQETPDAVNLVREIYFQEGNLGMSHEGAHSFLEYLGGHGELLQYFGAYEGDLRGIIGYEESGHICLFFVRKEDRGRGIGSELIHALIQEAKRLQIGRLSVNALKDSVKSYEHFGFEVIGEEKTEDGITTLPMEYLLAQEYLGKVVTVTVDHPYGSFHPYYGDLLYPCNYGYVDECLSFDGDFQNAYVIGPEEPVEQYKGTVIGILYRKDANESYWIVTKNKGVSRQEVIDTIGEIEQYYDTRMIWMKD